LTSRNIKGNADLSKITEEPNRELSTASGLNKVTKSQRKLGGSVDLTMGTEGMSLKKIDRLKHSMAETKKRNKAF